MFCQHQKGVLISTVITTGFPEISLAQNLAGRLSLAVDSKAESDMVRQQANRVLQERSPNTRRLAVLLWIAASAALPISAFGGLRDPPLPDDAVVISPGDGVPDRLKPFAGKWSGNIFFASIHLPHIVVIEKIEPVVVWAVWSLGLSQHAGGPGAWYRIPIRVQGDTLIASGNRGRLTYRLRSNDEIEVSGTQAGGYPVSGTLERQAMPTRPNSEIEPATYWPIGIAQLMAGKAAGAYPSIWPESLSIAPPAPGIASERTKWLGKWSGWACGHDCDAKLAVLEVTEKDAKVLEIWTSDVTKAVPTVRQGKFIGDELVVRDKNYRASYRMRANGEVEILRARLNALAWGVLTKDP